MKKFIITTLVLPLFILLTPVSSEAQPLSNEDIKTQLIKEWERAKAYTIDYLNTMPVEKYSFKAVDSIRSFAQQMLHLAGGNIFLMRNATEVAPAIPGFGPDVENRQGAQKKDSVMYFVSASYDYCINAVKNTDLSKWGEKKKIFGFEETRFALIMKTFEHQTHHRGQTTIYIRELGIKPPQERLF